MQKNYRSSKIFWTELAIVTFSIWSSLSWVKISQSANAVNIRRLEGQEAKFTAVNFRTFSSGKLASMARRTSRRSSSRRLNDDLPISSTSVRRDQSRSGDRALIEVAVVPLNVIFVLKKESLVNSRNFFETWKQIKVYIEVYLLTKCGI